MAGELHGVAGASCIYKPALSFLELLLLLFSLSLEGLVGVVGVLLVVVVVDCDEVGLLSRTL